MGGAGGAGEFAYGTTPLQYDAEAAAAARNGMDSRYPKILLMGLRRS